MKESMKEATIDFNKELLFGEIGSVICAPLVALIVSRVTSAAGTISTSAVVGSNGGGSGGEWIASYGGGRGEWEC